MYVMSSLQDEKYYLRALGDDPRKVSCLEYSDGSYIVLRRVCLYIHTLSHLHTRSHPHTHAQDVADLRTQFPVLAEDIRLPLFCDPEQYFSSVFRVGSPHVQLWTHYDVSAPA